MKLECLKVENFKSLENLEIEFFKEKNLFYGFNNAGKSNIFKFLNILFKSKEIRVPIEVGEKYDSTQVISIDPRGFWQGEIYDQPFLFTNNDRIKPINFEVVLSIFNSTLEEIDKGSLNEKGFIGKDFTFISLKGKILSKNFNTSIIELSEAKCNDIIFYTFSDEIENFFPEIKEKGKLDRAQAESILSLFNNCVLYIETERNFKKELFNTLEGQLRPDNFKNWLFDLNIDSDKNEKFVKLTKFLKSFDFSEKAKAKLIFNLKSFPFGELIEIGFTKFHNEVEIMLRNEFGRFPLSNYGTGIQQFFYLMTLIFWSERRIIIIEELELNLSPLYQEEILRFLSDLKNASFYDQLLFSTHSPFFTQKSNYLIDSVHLVRFMGKGTIVESYEISEIHYDEHSNESLVSFLYS